MKARIRNLRIAGVALLCIASVLAFLWFYVLAPWRNLHSWSWLKNHSERRKWVEVQRQLKRTGADHDSSIGVGYFGNEKWTKWVIQSLKPSYELRSCGTWPYHLPDALPLMTNQELTNDAEWIAWWETNKNKTQVEWIRDGFARAGIELQRPLTTNNVITLLKLIAPSAKFPATTNTMRAPRQALRYNAERWLRESGFRYPGFDLASVPAEDRDVVTWGLVTYAFWLGEHWDDPGRLQFSRDDDSGSPFIEPWFNRPLYSWLINSILIVMAVGGVFLLRLASKRKSIS